MSALAPLAAPIEWAEVDRHLISMSAGVGNEPGRSPLTGAFRIIRQPWVTVAFGAIQSSLHGASDVGSASVSSMQRRLSGLPGKRFAAFPPTTPPRGSARQDEWLSSLRGSRAPLPACGGALLPRRRRACVHGAPGPPVFLMIVGARVPGRRLPPLNAIRAFEAAGRHVSFTKAAEELRVTHGAISRQVAQLEAWLGISLFLRKSSQLSLTPSGRSYLAEVTAALDRLAVASLHLLDQAAPSTTLHVNAPPTFTMRWLIPRLSGFQRRHPGMEVRMTTSLAPVRFEAGGYDVAIRGAHAPLPGCVSVPFMTELILPVCHADLAESGQLREPCELAVQTLISYATEPYAWTDWLAAAGVAGLRPAGALRFEQMYFALQAAAEGLGVVLVPVFLAIDDILAGRLCAPFGTLAARQRRYYANAAHQRPAVDAFIEWLVREGRDTEQAMEAWAKGAPS